MFNVTHLVTQGTGSLRVLRGVIGHFESPQPATALGAVVRPGPDHETMVLGFGRRWAIENLRATETPEAILSPLTTAEEQFVTKALALLMRAGSQLAREMMIKPGARP